jgi:cytidylate kinase
MVKVIAIDGPASVGKSTLAKKISEFYNAPLLSSGRLYRAVALEIKKNKIKINDKNKIIGIAKKLKSEDLNSSCLFSSEVDTIASKISSRKYLRNHLIGFQRSFPEKYGKNKKFVIVEGRDIGTEIFPMAEFKIFMWADAKIRAKRRYKQILKKGQKASLVRIYDKINARDTKDLNRKVAPLKPAVNSVLLDTTYLDIEQAFSVVKHILKK